MPSSVRTIPLAPLCLFLGSAIAAQTPLLSVEGRPGSAAGGSVAPLGDLDHDGVVDLIVGMPFNNGFAGSARLFNGRTGAIISTVHADSADKQVFGWSVIGLDDVDNDGFVDFAVSAPDYISNGTRTGSVGVFSGRTQQRLRLHVGDGFGDLLGSSLANAGDVDKDGFADYVAGAPENGAINGGPGYARVFSGKDGSILYTFRGAMHADEFGIGVSGGSDVNRDGHADVLVGTSLESRIGSGDGTVWLFSGKDGSLIHKWFAEPSADHFGFSLAAPGDLDGDGVPDILAGAPNIITPQGRGFVRALSGRTGDVLYTVNGGPDTGGFGMRVCATGDVDGDSVPDFLVGGPGNHRNGVPTGSAQLFSGKDGKPLSVIWGAHAGAAFGCSMNAVGDINADGEIEVVIGECGYADSSGTTRGRARVFSLRDTVRTLPGCPGSRATLRSNEFVLGQVAVVGLRTQLPRRQGVLLFSALPSLPAGFGDCLLFLDPATATANFMLRTDASGDWALRFVVPNEQSLIGANTAIQAALEQPSSRRGFDLSNGVYVTVRQ